MPGPKLLPEIGTELGRTTSAAAPIADPVAQPAQQIPQQAAIAPPVVSPIQKRRSATRSSKIDLNKLMKMRKKIMNDLEKGIRSEDQVMDEIYASGITDPGAIEVVLSKELTDNVISFFLDRTNNDSKKAFKLARKFGFEV